MTTAILTRLAMSAAVAVVLAACAATPVIEPVDAPAAPDATPTLEDFCAKAQPMMSAVQREYIGSDQHVADFAALEAVTPGDLLEIVSLLRAHYDTDVDPAVPESQDFDNFSPAVQEAALTLRDEINMRC